MPQKVRSLRYPATAITFGFAVIVLLFILIADRELIKVSITLLSPTRLDATEEILVLLGFVAIAFFLDIATVRRRRKSESQLSQIRAKAELAAQSANGKLRAVHVTMRTVQDIVNNCLNELQMLRLDAEEHGVPQRSLVIFDNAVQATAAKMKSLGSLKVYVEKELAIGASLDTETEVFGVG